MTDYILETKRLSKAYKKEDAVKDVSIQIKRNTILLWIYKMAFKNFIAVTQLGERKTAIQD